MTPTKANMQRLQPRETAFKGQRWGFWVTSTRGGQGFSFAACGLRNGGAGGCSMSSEGPNHNEFDFEFLGNTTGEPYSVKTNVYVNGVGNREQRLNLWFDPTKDFHSYSFFWNQRQVM
ncbi:hypothetical protein HN51_061205 [Arachis hypogaea]|uniref:GH16 domain-containing protein n=1 Tax=Arachis hypogaea TaxID=3818 RepID=A0A445AMK5_ARAHY|nr:xyloglucan endotransglucosylase/hydrolase protein 9-like [Arachis hypogaea]RYR27594.1 hypothetical protein Ahy_B01g051610 [Arachis hypogaea]